MLLSAGGWGCGNGAALARVVASGGARAAGAGPWGVMAEPRGAGAARVGPGGGGGVVASWGAGEPGAGVSGGGGGGRFWERLSSRGNSGH